MSRSHQIINKIFRSDFCLRSVVKFEKYVLEVRTKIFTEYNISQ